MTEDTTHTAFFGDKEHVFRITPALIPELEIVTGCGIGALFKRLCAGTFHFNDMMETIRLGLIGGGESPQTAHRLVNTYANGRPLGEVLPLAIDILNALWFGTNKETPNEQI